MSNEFGFIGDLIDMSNDKLVERNGTAQSWKFNSLYLTDNQKRELMIGSKAIAKTLSSIHGLKPLNRKIWKAFKYTGKGDLSVLDILLTTLEHGKFELMERRKIKKNPEKPVIALLVDVSASNNNAKITRSTILISTLIMELFGNGFAKDFYCSTIGNGGTCEPLIMLRSDMEKAKKFIIDQQFADGNNSFLPSFQYLEEYGFFKGRYFKYIFIITDGLTEIWNPHTDRLLIDKTRFDNVNVGPYVKSHWESRKDVLYFWIQIAFNHIHSEIEYVTDVCKYCPPKEQITPEEYQKYALKSEPSNINYPLGEFFWDSFKKDKFILITEKSLKDGSAFHRIMEYIMRKFNQMFK